MISSLSLNAQSFIAPLLPETALPTALDYAVKDKIYNTSSYSYENVAFNISETATPLFKDMNLYVYSWSAGATSGSGIAYKRINALTGVVEHQDFVAVDLEKKYTEVGIIQDENKNTYVIALWYGYWEDAVTGINKGTYYDIYKWNTTALTLVSAANAINVFYGDATKSSMGQRVSMDCQNLNQVVFCWEEVPSSSPLNPGGIFLKALKPTGAPPFVVSPIFRLAGIPVSGTLYPDVAIGDNANKVRIAYRTPNLGIPFGYDLNVVNIPFSTFTAYPFVIPSLAYSTYYSIPFVTDYTNSGLIIESPFPYAFISNVNDQISIDCPDNYYDDIWAVAVGSKDQIIAVQKPTSSLPVILKNLTINIPDKNITPVVSFQNPSIMQGITYSWYNFGFEKYLATHIDYLGNYLPPVNINTFFIVNNTPIANAIRDAMRPTLSRNNNVSRGVLTAYPFNNATPSLFDMRHKIVQVPIGSFKSNQNPKFENDNTETISIAPNPIHQESKVFINNYQKETLSWLMTDNAGNNITENKNGKLNDLNNTLPQLISRLTSGNYFLIISYKKQAYILKLSKQ